MDNELKNKVEPNLNQLEENEEQVVDSNQQIESENENETNSSLNAVESHLSQSSNKLPQSSVKKKASLSRSKSGAKRKKTILFQPIAPRVINHPYLNPTNQKRVKKMKKSDVTNEKLQRQAIDEHRFESDMQNLKHTKKMRNAAREEVYSKKKKKLENRDDWNCYVKLEIPKRKN